MNEYRRARVPGASWFLALVERRHGRLLVDHIDAPRAMVRFVRERHPFHIDAFVVLPDHLHCVWALPEGDADYSTRWGLINSPHPTGSASGQTHGSRRQSIALREQGVNAGRHRVRTLMRANGIRLVWKRKFVHTTNSRQDLPIAENVLDRQFEPPAVNTAWVSDITYIRTRYGWLYLGGAGPDLPAMQDVTDYIVGFYNNVRLHSTLGYLAPNAYERMRATEQPIAVSEIA